FVLLYKLLISFCCPMPSFILHKGLVRTQIHRHRGSADWTAGHQFCRHFHFQHCIILQKRHTILTDPVSLTLHHPADTVLILISLVMAGSGTLPQTIIPLSIKQPVLLKTSFLETMIHVG